MRDAIQRGQHMLRLGFEAFDVTLPLSVSAECKATLIDANGRDVLTIDVNSDRPDIDAHGLSAMVADLVNRCAGLPARAEETV